MKQTTPFTLMTALAQGSSLHAAGLKAVLAVEREDGSGHSEPRAPPRVGYSDLGAWAAR